jgi:hypothetical protein
VSEAKLLPCPFCGAPAHLHTGTKSSSVICSSGDCPADPQVACAQRAEAVAAWNKRTPSARETPALDEVLGGFADELDCHGCITGDCPHDMMGECWDALAKHIKAVAKDMRGALRAQTRETPNTTKETQ